MVVPITRDPTLSINSIENQTFKDYHSTLIYDQGIGPGKARNLGISKSDSEWIAFLDDDDIWDSNHLETLFNYSNDFDFIFSRPHSVPDHAYEMPVAMMKNIIEITGGITYGSGILIHRSVLDSLGGFDENYWYSEIWLLCRRALVEGVAIKHVPVNTWNRGRNPEQLSMQNNHFSIREERLSLYLLLPKHNNLKYFYDNTPTTHKISYPSRSRALYG